MLSAIGSTEGITLAEVQTLKVSLVNANPFLDGVFAQEGSAGMLDIVRESRHQGQEAVLERHSFQVMLGIMSDPRYDLFEHLPPQTAEMWRNILSDIILATDFAMHRNFLDEYKVYMSSHEADFSDPVFLSWVTRALMKGADIANTSKPFPQAKVWGKRVMLDFWAQGAAEKEHNFPVGPLNDPETVRLNAAQAGFIKFAALELFELLAELDPGLAPMVTTLKDNLVLYEDRADSE